MSPHHHQHQHRRRCPATQFLLFVILALGVATGLGIWIAHRSILLAPSPVVPHSDTVVPVPAPALTQSVPTHDTGIPATPANAAPAPSYFLVTGPDDGHLRTYELTPQVGPGVYTLVQPNPKNKKIIPRQHPRQKIKAQPNGLQLDAHGGASSKLPDDGHGYMDYLDGQDHRP